MRLIVPLTMLVTAREEVAEQLLALRVADLLQDHLLGVLREAAAERDLLLAAAVPRCARSTSMSGICSRASLTG